MDNRAHETTPIMDESEFQNLLDQTARDEASNIKPRVYHLDGIESGPIKFFVLGCHGNGGETQKETAALMNSVMENMQNADEPTPIFSLFLGDNMYDYGVPSPSAKGFHDCFHKIYYDIKKSVLNTIPSFLLLGNHDDNLHGKALLSSNPSGDETGINQVAHTIIANKPEHIRTRAAFYKQKKLDIKKLSHWNMPYLYYSVVAGDTQIFCLNSNTYLQDYLELHRGQTTKRSNDDGSYDVINTKTNRVNQAWWFEKEYTAARLAGRQVFVAQHHPLEVVGKRSFPAGFDYNHYMNWDQIIALNEILASGDSNFIKTASFNALIASVFKHQKIQPDLVLAAHEHLISMHHEVNQQTHETILRQFTAGGGGGDLQKRKSYRNHPAVRLLQEHNGFGIITVYPGRPQEYTLDVHTTQGLHLQFNSNSPRPVMQKNADPDVEKLRKCILKSCSTYFNILKDAELSLPPQKVFIEKPPKDTGVISFLFRKANDAWQSVVDNASFVLGHIYHNAEAEKENRLIHDMQAYCSQIVLPDYKSTLQHLHSLTQQLPSLISVANNSFYSILQKNIRAAFQQDMESLVRKANQTQAVNTQSFHEFRM